MIGASLAIARGGARPRRPLAPVRSHLPRDRSSDLLMLDVPEQNLFVALQQRIPIWCVIGGPHGDMPHMVSLRRLLRAPRANRPTWNVPLPGFQGVPSSSLLTGLQETADFGSNPGNLRMF